MKPADEGQDALKRRREQKVRIELNHQSQLLLAREVQELKRRVAALDKLVAELARRPA